MGQKDAVSTQHMSWLKILTPKFCIFGRYFRTS